MDLFTTLTELDTLAESVASQIDDTRLAVGGEAMQEAIRVYDYVKTGAKTTPGLKPVARSVGRALSKDGRTEEVGRFGGIMRRGGNERRRRHPWDAGTQRWDAQYRRRVFETQRRVANTLC
uniref:Uncharacterized protein n=1 Tax=Candidatus Kentrum eta TaxID=2126337 RepID=A0A450UUI3_9GAMM|nr:MAG: hypothetical protein BECKH772A_GA0070896_1008516 [Candidatus Kentron sp. H]VFJ96214.1 MAG: hypothetical protein BECKH772B_GA0070898_1008816 [Candidatus Kentron sp. H]VFK02210.1 MAG: hypothetical protein BECKH772C_GA0070978_1008416 [Candidatus Kentron sp. H]